MVRSVRMGIIKNKAKKVTMGIIETMKRERKERVTVITRRIKVTTRKERIKE